MTNSSPVAYSPRAPAPRGQRAFPQQLWWAGEAGPADVTVRVRVRVRARARARARARG
jgi:hypothetical protein